MSPLAGTGRKTDSIILVTVSQRAGIILVTVSQRAGGTRHHRALHGKKSRVAENRIKQ